MADTTPQDTADMAARLYDPNGAPAPRPMFLTGLAAGLPRSPAPFPLMAFLALVCQLLAGQSSVRGRETVLDQVVHLEDSLSHTVPYLPRLCDQTDSQKGRVDLGGYGLYVETEGEGVPLVVINGGPGGTHHYFHPWFSQLKDACKVIYYDQRGTGQSDFVPGADGYSFGQAVDDLEKLREELGIPQWFVCGFSYGGAIAQYYTATYPERVRGLILVSALPLFESDRFSDEQGKYLSDSEISRRKELIREYVAGHLKMDALVYNLALNGDWKRQHFYRPTREETIRSALYEWVNDTDFNAIVSADLARYNLRDAFEGCPVPTLLFEGRNDLTWGPDKALVLSAAHPKAQFIWYDRAGHSLYQDVPGPFFSSLRDFVKTARPASARKIRKWRKNTAGRPGPNASR